MVINEMYCQYKGKVYRCSLNRDCAYVRSNDKNDFLNNQFISNPGLEDLKIKDYSAYLKECSLPFGPGKYFKKIPIADIDWFCYVFTVGYYKECEVSIRWEENGKYKIDISNVSNPNSKEYKVFTTENGFRMYDRYDWCGDVPKSEVQNIVQMVGPESPDLKAPDNWDFQIPGDDNEFPRRVVPYE